MGGAGVGVGSLEGCLCVFGAEDPTCPPRLRVYACVGVFARAELEGVGHRLPETF